MSYITPELVEAVTARHYELAGVPVPGQGRRPYAARHHRPRQARRRNTRRSRRHRPPRRPPAVDRPGLVDEPAQRSASRSRAPMAVIPATSRSSGTPEKLIRA